MATIKKHCTVCSRSIPVKQSVPLTPILSSGFAERFVIDLKQFARGYMVVCVDHYTNYVFLGFLKKEEAALVAEFLRERVFPEVERIIKGYDAVDAETTATSSGTGVSRPVNPPDTAPLKDRTSTMQFTPAQLGNQDTTVEVRLRCFTAFSGDPAGSPSPIVMLHTCNL